MILEISTDISCDICDRKTKKYIFDEEDDLFLCPECFEERGGEAI